MAANRTADDIQRDIEQARAELAVAVDQLAERASPKRLMAETKQKMLAKARSPAGMAVIRGAGAVVLLIVVGRVRRRRAVGKQWVTPG